MKVTLSLSEEARTRYEGNSRGTGLGYMGSRFLAEAFVKRGHDLTVIHPHEVYFKSGRIYSKKAFSFNNGIFSRSNSDSSLEGDVFFVYSLAEENGVESSKRFVDALFRIENQFDHTINSAESTSYEFKPKQKTLDLPWIPTFEVRSKLDLHDLINSGEKIIAKPNIGACGQGIVYLDKEESIDLISTPSDFLYEKFIPSNEERRYIFLNGQLIIRRRGTKEGFPGRERFSNIDLMEGNPTEIEIARRAIEQTGMFFGAVDFRGDYILEINGSGTGIAPPTVTDEYDSYNLSDTVVQAVERLVKNEYSK